MPAYTAADLRNYIDDLDAALRKAVQEDKIKKVFALERPRIVSVKFSKVHI